MLIETAKEAKERNIHWIDLQLMNAEHLDFPDNHFDFVFCGFALFFFPSILKALSEFKRVLKPGEKLVFSTWGKDSELDAWINERTEEFHNRNSFVDTALWSESCMKAILNNAHFRNVHILEETKTFLHSTPKEWWDSLWTHGTRAVLEQLSSEQIANLQEKAVKRAERLDKGEGVIEEIQVFYGIAQKS